MSRSKRPRGETPPSATPTWDARSYWDEGTLSDFFADDSVENLVLRDDEICFDWLTEAEDIRESYHLRRVEGAKYVGEAVTGVGREDALQARVEAVLYSNEQGHLLIGEKVYTDGYDAHFIVQFTKRQ